MIGQAPDPKRNSVRFSWAAAAVVLVCALLAHGEPLERGAEPAEPMGAIALVDTPLTDLGDLTEFNQVLREVHKPQVPSAVTKYKGVTLYTVQEGDSLYWVAATYGISVEELKELNRMKSDLIRVGQRLLVPVDHMKYYPAGVRLTNQEVEWLAQMIHAEARGEPYLGQVAVGAVIINRLLSHQFPNTLRGVLFQANAFQPIQNGSFYTAPNETARRAALEALNGHDPTNGALFFFNPRKTSDRFMHSRPVKVTIGNHRFTM
ncbi:MAG TPA: LysM peptidoglycan-binding domain-containing protein [Firmicutes bacterium]|nr:LysM peptidoglycan-binding domain-containing protein [Bacillota bacterium]